MTTKTLTDELRSVLLFHALQAPEPNATVDRILAETVGPVMALGTGAEAAELVGSEEQPGRGWRLTVQQLAAASVIAVLLLSVAGINSVRNRNAARSAARASQAQVNQPVPGPATAAGSMALPKASDNSLAGRAPADPPTHVGKTLDCSKIPGGHLVTGQWDDFTLSTGQAGYLYEFLCVGLNGQRSASEVQMFEQVGGRLRYVQTLLYSADDEHLDFMTAGMDSVRIQVSVNSSPLGGVPGAVVSTVWELSDRDGAAGFGAPVAEACVRKDLAATVTPVPDAAAPSWRLAMRNRTETACALEGFPQVRAQRNGATLTTALHTMSGTAGGVTKARVPPIIVLSPGATASAIIEQSSASAAGSCLHSDQLAVTLPNGVSLGQVPAELSGCGLAVHPLVGNARGSD
ncbi:MAG: hypothetical protein QOI26_2518 [Pseudonocardiales bacterium]|nr:hypothetical protein [Pseudonocardiales bacterium]